MNTKTSKADKGAIAALAAYVAAYAINRPFNSPERPRLSAGWEPTFGLGWPVRNLDGGGNIAYFTSYEAADLAACKARQ